MSSYISQREAANDRAKLRQAQRKLKIALACSTEIAGGIPCATPGCACCTPLDGPDPYSEHCAIGTAKVAAFLIKEIKT